MENPDLAKPLGIETALRDERTRISTGEEQPTGSPADIYRSIENRLAQMQRSIEFSTRRTTPISGQGGALAQAEAARETIRHLVDQGNTREQIIQQVVGSGISQLWAEDAIDEAIKESKPR